MTIGYYDPDTLILGDASASIDFISAADRSDRRRVEVRNRQEADTLLHNLRHQEEHQISVLGGRAIICRGPIQMSPGIPDEGVMMIDEVEGRLLPVKFGFDLGDYRVPERALIGAIGFMAGGAMIAERAAIAPLSPIPTQNSAPRQMG